MKYFMFGAISSAFLLFGLSYVYGLTGATNLREIGRVIQTNGASPLMAVGFAVHHRRVWIQGGGRAVSLVGAGRLRRCADARGCVYCDRLESRQLLRVCKGHAAWLFRDGGRGLSLRRLCDVAGQRC